MRSFFAKIESKANSKFIQFIMQRKTFVEKNYSKLFVICFYTESMPHMKQNKNSNFFYHIGIFWLNFMHTFSLTITIIFLVSIEIKMLKL